MQRERATRFKESLWRSPGLLSRKLDSICSIYSITFGGILKDSALLLSRHHREEGENEHPRAAASHAVAVVI